MKTTMKTTGPCRLHSCLKVIFQTSHLSTPIIYLTSDSNNVISSLEDDVYYVIGGLVDHNLHKGVSLDFAIKNNLKHGRLPIDEFVQMKTRKVLTINHVFHIITLVTENKSWQEAFLQVLPERKGVVVK